MTTPRKGRKGEPLAARLLREVESTKSEHRWPSPRWRDDPVGFFREVLMVEYLTEDQIAILQALTRPRARVSVASGHKTGKDFLAGGIAWWWACSDPEARVRATAVTAPQVRDVFWRELRAHFDRSHQHRDPVTGFMRPSPYPIDGVVPSLPHTGWRVGLREIVGFTADQGEAAAGISGRRVLYIYDEASGIDDMIFEASKGNLAGGDARALMLSQPTRNEGHFYDSHHEKRELWACFNLDSEKSPNVTAGREVVPGLATREWLDEQRIDWNAPDGPVWKIRVKGQFAEGTGQKVMTLDQVIAAERRWPNMPTPEGERLVLGLDCAGSGDDENACAPRRGCKILELERWPTPALPTSTERAKANAARVLGIVRRHRRPREPRALVVMDAGGTIGLEVYRELLRYEDEIQVRPVQFGAASTMPREYQWIRDQLWFGFAERWLQEGGALPPERKLPAELTAPSWDYDEKGRRHVEKKDRIRARLGRSTDGADACLLSVFEPPRVEEQAEEDIGPPPREIDPYAGAMLGGGAMIDPYGGSL